MPVYRTPVVTDYGSLTEITRATALAGPEDGGIKIDPGLHHSAPAG